MRISILSPTGRHPRRPLIEAPANTSSGGIKNCRIARVTLTAIGEVNGERREVLIDLTRDEIEDALAFCHRCDSNTNRYGDGGRDWRDVRAQEAIREECLMSWRNAIASRLT
jgi:uncharacterized membrane protein